MTGPTPGYSPWEQSPWTVARVYKGVEEESMSVQSLGSYRSPAANARPQQGPVGGGLFDPPPPQNPFQAIFGPPPPRNPFEQIRDVFSPRPQNPFEQIRDAFTPRQQNPLQRMWDSIFRPSNPIDAMQYDMRRAADNMQRQMSGQGTTDWWRIGAWGAGGVAVWQVVAANMRNRPEGIMALALIGAGAFAGNWVYDYFKYKM